MPRRTGGVPSARLRVDDISADLAPGDEGPDDGAREEAQMATAIVMPVAVRESIPIRWGQTR